MTATERTTKTHTSPDGSTVEVPTSCKIGDDVEIGDESDICRCSIVVSSSRVPNATTIPQRSVVVTDDKQILSFSKAEEENPDPA